MSEASVAKDARGILNSAGREVLRAALHGAEPMNPTSPNDPMISNPQPHEPFPITRASEMKGVAEAADFVEGLLTEGGASVVYGPSNCGKSFWILDLAASVTQAAEESALPSRLVILDTPRPRHGRRRRKQWPGHDESGAGHRRHSSRRRGACLRGSSPCVTKIR